MVGTDGARPEDNACVLDRSVWRDQSRSAEARMRRLLQQHLHVGEGGFSQQDIIDLGAGLVDRIDASGPLALTVEQYRALGAVALTAANTVTLADTAANLALLSRTEIGLLGARGIDYIDATDNALSLSLDQYLNLGVVKLTASDTVSLADTAANIGTLSLAQLRGLGKPVRPKRGRFVGEFRQAPQAAPDALGGPLFQPHPSGPHGH
jgi:hypothetical protein